LLLIIIKTKRTYELVRLLNKQPPAMHEQ